MANYGITLADAQAKLSLWLAAEEKVGSGQKVEIDGQALTRADLGKIGERITYWDEKCKTLGARSEGRGRSVTARPGW